MVISDGGFFLFTHFNSIVVIACEYVAYGALIMLPFRRNQRTSLESVVKVVQDVRLMNRSTDPFHLLLVLAVATSMMASPAVAQPADTEDVVAEAPVVPTPTTRPALEGPFAASHTYQFLQRRIVTHKANLEDLPGFRLVIRDDVEFAKIRHALETAAQKPTPESYRQLYTLFSRATPNPDVLYQYLDEALAKEIERGLAAPDDATQFYAWPAVNGLSALIDAFEATQDVRFLELFIRTYDRILAHRDSEHRRRDEVRKRVMRTWGFRHRNK